MEKTESDGQKELLKTVKQAFKDGKKVAVIVQDDENRISLYDHQVGVLRNIEREDINDFYNRREREDEWRKYDNLEFEDENKLTDILSAVAQIGMPEMYIAKPEAKEFKEALLECPAPVKIGFALIVEQYAKLAKQKIEDLWFQLKKDVGHDTPEFREKMRQFRKETKEKEQRMKLLRQSMGINDQGPGA